MLFKLAFLFPIFLVFLTFYSAYGGITFESPHVESEFYETKSQKECSENGGYLINIRPKDGESINTGVKIKKNQTGKVAYNYGAPFNGFNVGAPDQSQYKDLDNLFVYYNDGGEVNIKTSSDQGIYYCERIFNYKCLHDIIINTTKNFDDFTKYECEELYGDLIIKGLGKGLLKANPKNNPNFFSAIRKIRGRLVIERIEFDSEIVFSELEEVGQYAKNKLLPSIHIVENMFKEIKFPKMELKKCYNDSPKNCARIERNRNYTSPEVQLGIKFKTVTSPEAWFKEDDVFEDIQTFAIPNEEKMKVKSEAEMRKRNWNIGIEDWQKQGFPGISYIGYGIFALLALWLVALIVFQFYEYRKAERVDYKEISTNIDSKSIKEAYVGDYFDVGPKGDNNRNSGMDDLGSS